MLLPRSNYTNNRATCLAIYIIFHHAAAFAFSPDKSFITNKLQLYITTNETASGILYFRQRVRGTRAGNCQANSRRYTANSRQMFARGNG